MFLGIDPGIRTLSWALVDETGVVEAGTTDLIAGVPKSKHKKYAWLVHRWMQAHIHLFDAELIVVEQQMSQKMRIIETAHLISILGSNNPSSWPHVRMSNNIGIVALEPFQHQAIMTLNISRSKQDLGLREQVVPVE